MQAAAYRAGVDLLDERTGMHAHYAHRSEHGHIGQTLLVLPSGATPDRGTLWNDLERHHKRGDATLAWEIENALPTALTPEQNAKLVSDYAKELAARYGVAVDACIHTSLDNRPNDEISPLDAIFEDKPENPHVHIMLSACLVDMDDKLGKKCVALDPIHCKRNGLPTPADRERARWCELVNEALAAAGHEVRVDHRTLKEQGIDRDPQRHAGKGAVGVWAEITTHNEQCKADEAELARLDVEYAKETAKLKAIMREIEITNEPRKPFIPTSEREAGIVRDRFNALVDERMDNHKADTARVTEIEGRLAEINEIHLSQPMFWQYKRKQEKAKVEIEWKHLQDEHRELRHVKGTTCSRKEAAQAVMQEFPEYKPAIDKVNEYTAIVLQRMDETLRKGREQERQEWLQERAREALEAKAAELAPKPVESKLEPLERKETPSKRIERDDDGLTM